MKFWADGSNQAESAAQSQPYLKSSSKGHANYDVAQMTALCRTARDAGWPILIHCQGDAAVEDALDAIEQAYGANPATGLNRIEHATMARPDQIERMKRLGIEPSFIPDFVYLYGGDYRDQIFGPQRANFMVPAGAAAQAGVPFTLHSNSPATGLPINPLRHVQTAVTRRCATDDTVVGAGHGDHDRPGNEGDHGQRREADRTVRYDRHARARKGSRSHHPRKRSLQDRSIEDHGDQGQRNLGRRHQGVWLTPFRLTATALGLLRRFTPRNYGLAHFGVVAKSAPRVDAIQEGAAAGVFAPATC